ncbi:MULTISPECIES: hypothetical protein [unclassified Sphingobium]|uniref:hypothetical protein n=1 Tax=unclassified Sphingobium TaxID=2611147 RepID=UPI000D175E2B|nr:MULTISPECIES: hypothetical protein [unclassified Sphingobium]MBG6120477.1 hypothetical protein [Sphingobium sp. JAI105]PSO09595.1 hypothetical protein C7E20_21735 [Sphingobium sp. AEW4]
MLDPLALEASKFRDPAVDCDMAHPPVIAACHDPFAVGVRACRQDRASMHVHRPGVILAHD